MIIGEKVNSGRNEVYIMVTSAPLNKIYKCQLQECKNWGPSWYYWMVVNSYRKWCVRVYMSLRFILLPSFPFLKRPHGVYCCRACIRLSHHCALVFASQAWVDMQCYVSTLPHKHIFYLSTLKTYPKFSSI